MEYTESDLLWRLLEPLYDVSWAYHMSSTVDHVAKRMERHRKTFSSTASVVSTATLATTTTAGSLRSTSGLSVSDKVVAMETMLRRVARVMRARQFEDICRVSLKSSDDLYPGFRDVLFIAQFLLERGEAYTGQLSCDETNGLTLTQVFQSIFYEFCGFLLSGRKIGKEATKLIITPTKITHVAYDLCRQKFARLLADQTGIVQDGLLRLIDRIKKDREPLPCSSSSPNNQQQQQQEEVPDASATAPAEPEAKKGPEPEPEAFDTGEGRVVVVATRPEAPPAAAPSSSAGRQTRPRNASSTAASVPSRVSFPVIELSSSSDESSEDDQDSVSSLDSDL